MLKNYFKTTVNYLLRNKGFTTINIIGLSTGICVCFFALLYVQFELSRDSYNKRSDRIYRLVTDVKTTSGVSYESAPAPLGPAMEATFPEVKYATRVFMDDMIIRSKPNNASKEEIAYADASVFSVFTWSLLKGDPKHLFDAPFTVVLTETAAKKYFGTTDVVGQTLIINSTQRAAVTGVMKDIPYNSHLKVDMLFSISSLVNEGWDHHWDHFGFYTYLLLQPNTDAAKLSAKLPGFVKTHFDQSRVKYSLSIEPLKNVYLYGKPRGHRTGSSASGSIANVYLFSIIAVFVLFIACFNFINLTTAFSMKRAREIGVRKVLGASKKQLIIQFFMDAVLLCLVAFVIALSLAAGLLPLFNRLAGTIVSEGIFTHLNYIGWLLLTAICVGLLSGIYPALFLSGFKPVKTLKGNFNPGGGGLGLRKSLVITQFSISIMLIIATSTIYSQLDFMQNQQLGFKKQHQLVIDFQFDARIQDHADLVKSQLNSIPGINGASMSLGIPGIAGNQYLTSFENNDNEKQELKTDAYFVDDTFLKQYGISIIAGRGFSKQYVTDEEQAMLINETMAKKLGFKKADDAIGKQFSQLGSQGIIIGVVKDFHYHSFQEEIQPLTIRAAHGFFTSITLNVSSDHLQQTIDAIDKQWKQLAPGLPLVYYFADEAFNQQYIAQQRFGNLFVCFSALAILISSLGLLGLAAFNTAQRKKEIGIRKVLGASATRIAVLLSRDFAKLVIIALFIASPAAFWLMHTWLQGFAYHIQISVWVFILSGATALLVALLTISFQSIKAALVNPVKSLKSE